MIRSLNSFCPSLFVSFEMAALFIYFQRWRGNLYSPTNLPNKKKKKKFPTYLTTPQTRVGSYKIF